MERSIIISILVVSVLSILIFGYRYNQLSEQEKQNGKYNELILTSVIYATIVGSILLLILERMYGKTSPQSFSFRRYKMK